jgi:predicted acyl esterase
LLELGNLITGNSFAKGHRIRVQVSATFYPHFSRNLHTGLSETTEAGVMRRARIAIHHSREHPSSITLTVLGGR